MELKLHRVIYPYKYSPVWRLLHPRRFIAYGVGLEKSGTHSIAKMLSANYRSEHESNVAALNNLVIDVHEGKAPSAKLENALRRRDKYGWLEMDASHPHVHYLPQLLQMNPTAMVVLTIRDCFSWLDSVTSQHVLKPKRDYFDRLHDWRYNVLVNGEHDSRDLFLKEDYGLPSVAAYMSYWSYHISRVLEFVPNEQLLILRTFELRQKASELADFIGIPVESVDLESSHSYKAPRKLNVLAELGESYLRDKSAEFCSSHMEKFFADKDYLEIALKRSERVS